MNKFKINLGSLTGWSNTDAQIECDCPRCGVSAGFYCETPKGRRTFSVHTERSKRYFQKIGREEYDKRHSIKFEL